MAGHKKPETTKKYSISTNNPDLIKRTVELLDTIYQPREITLPDGTTMATMPTSEGVLTARQNILRKML